MRLTARVPDPKEPLDKWTDVVKMMGPPRKRRTGTRKTWSKSLNASRGSWQPLPLPRPSGIEVASTINRRFIC